MRLTIDALQFARDGSSIEGDLSADQLTRIEESGATAEGAWFRVTGKRSARGKAALEVRVQCMVTMPCQRCLEPVRCDVDETVELELSEDQREIDAAEDEIDRVLASPSLDLIGLVEDEILLALPMVARHAACVIPGGADEQADQEQSGPWAALARRKHS